MNSTDPVELLTSMLAIDSVSGEEAALARFLTERMDHAGLRATIDDAGNATGERSGPGEVECDVVLLGHMDTVPGRIPVRVDGDRLYGRGAVDAKGPLAAFVAAAAVAELPAGVRITVVGAVEEESATSRGARHVAQHMQPDVCVIGEPSGWNAVTIGYKGRLLADYRCERPASHSAGPHATVAEQCVAWWNGVSAYASDFNRGRGRAFDQLLTSLRHVRTSSDGLTDVAEATAGFRLPPGFDASKFETIVRAHAAEATVSFRGLERAWQSARTTPLAAAFVSAIRSADGSPRFKLKTGTSDMNVVGPVWGCPIVAYGPGDSALDHTPDEHIEIPEFLRSVEVLRTVLASSALRRNQERNIP